MEGGRKLMTEDGMEACRQASNQRAEVTEKIGDFVFEVGTTCSHLAARRHVLRYLHAGETIILCGGCALDGQ